MTIPCSVREITAPDLKARLDSGGDLILIDVRDPHELKICSLDCARHIVLGDLRFHLEELEDFKDREIVFYCRTGRRSAQACLFMQDMGFSRVSHLAGGLHAWSDLVDPTVPKYSSDKSD